MQIHIVWCQCLPLLYLSLASLYLDRHHHQPGIYCPPAPLFCQLLSFASQSTKWGVCCCWMIPGCYWMECFCCWWTQHCNGGCNQFECLWNWIEGVCSIPPIKELKVVLSTDLTWYCYMTLTREPLRVNGTSSGLMKLSFLSDTAKTISSESLWCLWILLGLNQGPANCQPFQSLQYLVKSANRVSVMVLNSNPHLQGPYWPCQYLLKYVNIIDLQINT